MVKTLSPWSAPAKKQRRSVIGIICGMLIAIFVIQNPSKESLVGRVITRDENAYPILAKCSGKEEQQLYRTFGMQSPGPDTIDLWSQQYAKQVSAVIEDYMEEDQQINCLKTSIDHVPGTASPQLQSLAGMLPPWKDGDLHMLARIDTGLVLLELLRTYECALAERYFFLLSDSAADLITIKGNNISWFELFDEFKKQRRKIEKELAISRPALHKTLALLNKSGGLRMLRRNIECVKRASIDMRNGLALGAEAAACMPRIQDAKGPLRDIQ